MEAAPHDPQADVYILLVIAEPCKAVSDIPDSGYIRNIVELSKTVSHVTTAGADE
jgi:hypothetical protein